jgi:predicted ATPase
MQQHKLDEALEQLVAAELVFRRGTPPDAEYTFKHALVQDAAYSTLLRSRRQQLHSRIAATLEVRFPEIAVAQPQLLAHHCAEAGLTEKALGYRLTAGHHLMSRSAMVEAEAQIRGGLALVPLLPDEAARQHREVDLQMALGSILFATAGYAATTAGKALARARQLCETLDRPSDLAVLLTSQCGHHMLAGELALALKEGKEIVALGERRNDADIKFCGYAISATVWFHTGDFAAAQSYAELALSLYRSENPLLRWLVQDFEAMCKVFVFRSLAYLGYLDTSRAHRDLAVIRASEQKHAHTLAMVLEISFQVDCDVKSDPTALLKCADEMIAHCAEHGFPFWEAAALGDRGKSLLMLGRTDEALSAIMKSLADFRATGAVTTVPMALTWIAEALRKAGRPSEGFAQLATAYDQIQKTEERWYEAELHRVYGTLLVAAGDFASAEERFWRATTVARRQSAKLWEIRAATNLAQLWLDQGERDRARDLLAPIYGWFTEGFDTRVLRDAKTLLDELN